MKSQTKRRMSNIGTVVVVGMLLLVAGSAAAQPSLEREMRAAGDADGILGPSSTMFSYQGQLLDGTGEPIDGSVTFEFELYDSETGGTRLWGPEAHVAVEVVGGLFHVLLGSRLAIDPAVLTEDVYLQLAVNGETLTPRERFTSVVYAIEAETLPDGARTRGALTVAGNLTAIGVARGANDVTETEYTEIGHAGPNGYINTVGDGLLQFQHDGVPLMSLSDAGDLVLSHELTVNGNETSKFEGNVQVGNNAWVPTFADMNGSDLAVAGQFEQQGGGGARFYKVGIGTDPLDYEGTLATSGSVSIGGTLNMTGNDIDNVDDILGGGGTTSPGIKSGRSLLVFIDTNNDSTDAFFKLYANSSSTPTADELFSVLENGNARVFGDLHVDGTFTGGAYVESKLQTEEEQKSGRIDRFEEGDVLCWGVDQLELCTMANDRLVQAVAGARGRPIVLGAEVIKVLGPVKRGDILVASDVPGYAMVNNDPVAGSVIAQALEDMEGERGLIKAMIRKF